MGLLDVLLALIFGPRLGYLADRTYRTPPFRHDMVAEPPPANNAYREQLSRRTSPTPAGTVRVWASALARPPEAGAYVEWLVGTARKDAKLSVVTVPEVCLPGALVAFVLFWDLVGQKRLDGIAINEDLLAAKGAYRKVLCPDEDGLAAGGGRGRGEGRRASARTGKTARLLSLGFLLRRHRGCEQSG